MWQEFKAFLTKSNAIALAVGVVIGGAVGGVVSAIVKGLIMPLVGLLTPKGGWESWAFGPDGAFKVGEVLAALVNFAVVGFVIFVIVKALVREKPAPPPPPMKACPFCLASIPQAATKCQACTSSVP